MEEGSKQEKKQLSKGANTAAVVVLGVCLIGAFVAAYGWWNDIWWFDGAFKPGPSIALESTEITIGRSMLGPVATGTISNTTGKAIKNVQVEVNLYDKDDVLVGTAVALDEVLEVGENWTYQAIIDPAGITRVELKDITGFK